MKDLKFVAFGLVVMALTYGATLLIIWTIYELQGCP